MSVRVETFFQDLEQDVQAMWEADAAAEWERISKPDEDAEKMMDAAPAVRDSYHFICKAMDALYDAFKEVEGTVAEDKIASLMNDLEDLQDDVLSMKCDLERGEC